MFIFFTWQKNIRLSLMLKIYSIRKVLVHIFSVNIFPKKMFCEMLHFATFLACPSAIKSSQQGNYHEQCQLLTNYQSLMAFEIFAWRSSSSAKALAPPKIKVQHKNANYMNTVKTNAAKMNILGEIYENASELLGVVINLQFGPFSPPPTFAVILKLKLCAVSEWVHDACTHIKLLNTILKCAPRRVFFSSVNEWLLLRPLHWHGSSRLWMYHFRHAVSSWKCYSTCFTSCLFCLLKKGLKLAWKKFTNLLLCFFFSIYWILFFYRDESVCLCNFVCL